LNWSQRFHTGWLPENGRASRQPSSVSLEARPFPIQCPMQPIRSAETAAASPSSDRLTVKPTKRTTAVRETYKSVIASAERLDSRSCTTALLGASKPYHSFSPATRSAVLALCAAAQALRRTSITSSAPKSILLNTMATNLPSSMPRISAASATPAIAARR
jgi:hypothetical protein